MSPQSRQTVRYLTTPDRVRVAWAETGSGGPPLVKAANWLTHLEFDHESPVWHHWISFFAEHFRFVRYDQRGCGMSDGEHAEISFEHAIADLECVIEAAGIDEPVTLLGISQGAAACIGYAVRHPERVARIILYGGFALGFAHVPQSPAVSEFRAIVDLARFSWGKDNPAFRSVFTSQFIPDATEQQLRWFNDLCQRSTTGPTAARMLEAAAEIDVVDLLPRVQVPTLVLHARNDAVVPVESGRRIAARIPNATFVELESRNHVLLRPEPAWARFCEEVLRFTGTQPTITSSPFAELTPRQREILSLLVEGLGNAAIAERLGLREKTVRNQLSSLFDKLGVWTRAQAMVFARDHHFDSNVP